MTEVEEFIEGFNSKQYEILMFFHQSLTTRYNLTAKLRFKIPFYYSKSWICYLSPKKENVVEFAFLRGSELINCQSFLDAKGRKQVYSFDVSEINQKTTELIDVAIQEAIILDQSIPYQSKRTKEK